MDVDLKLPWVLDMNTDPGCAQCSKEGVRGQEIRNADGELVFSSGHEIYFMPEFDLPTVVAAINAYGAK